MLLMLFQKGPWAQKNKNFFKRYLRAGPLQPTLKVSFFDSTHDATKKCSKKIKKYSGILPKTEKTKNFFRVLTRAQLTEWYSVIINFQFLAISHYIFLIFFENFFLHHVQNQKRKLLRLARGVLLRYLFKKIYFFWVHGPLKDYAYRSTDNKI